MPFPISTISTNTPALAADFNDVQSQLNDQLGLGDDGYGIAATFSQGVTGRNRMTANQMGALIRDVNLIHEHITNASTTTLGVNTGTSIVGAAILNDLKGISDWLIDPVRRYTCHPQQYVLNTATNTPLLFVSTSTRTDVWGGATGINSISHGLVATFPTRSQARYYFNLGNYLTWQPYFYQANVPNDADKEWAAWIEWLVNTPGQSFVYSRNEYINYTIYTQVYTSGTLQISVVAAKQLDEKNIKFTVTYTDNDSSTLLVLPSVAGYSITA